jgi:competence protein ComFA
VLAFRNGEIDILVTTTILERGITVKKADVHIFHADARVFTSTALIQMAGRAGRSAADANAHVYAWSNEKSVAMLLAYWIIRTTNQLAIKQGYIKKKAHSEEDKGVAK